jgi:hypothetical protein
MAALILNQALYVFVRIAMKLALLWYVYLQTVNMSAIVLVSPFDRLKIR